MNSVRPAGSRKTGFRRLAVMGAGVLVVALPAAALASAQFKQTAPVKLTNPTAGASTGITANLVSSDAGNPGNKPKALTKLTLKLPAGTHVDGKGVKQCNGLTNAQILAGQCPKKSSLGKGTAKANGFPLIPTTTEDIASYATKNGVLFALTDNVKDPMPAQTLVLKGKLSSRGVLTASVPPLPLPIPGQFAVLTNFKVKINAKSIGKHVFLRAPKNCTKKGFKTVASFKYADGSKFSVTTKQGCKK
jgi:hypothetical protein